MRTQDGAERADRLWALDVAGSEVYVYEVGTWRLLRVLEVGRHPHGIAATADGGRVFIGCENQGRKRGELLWFNGESLELEGRMPIGHEPHELECTPDGAFVYVPTSGGWQVVDVAAREVVKLIEVVGRPHNTTILPDASAMLLSPLAPAKEVSVVDLSKHEIVRSIPFGAAPRPAAVTSDGKRLLQNVDGLMGYAVADIATGQVARHESALLASKGPTLFHGLAINERYGEVWTANHKHQMVHVHALDGGEELRAVHTPGGPYWITMSRDDAFAAVSLPCDLVAPRRLARRLAVVCASLLGASLAFRLLAKERRWLRRLLFAGGLLVGGGAALMYFHVVSADGLVRVLDVPSSAPVVDLHAGRAPKRTLFIGTR